MLRTFGALLFAIFIFLVGWWTKDLGRENSELRSKLKLLEFKLQNHPGPTGDLAPPSPAPNTTNLEKQLAEERAKLEEITSKLDQLSKKDQPTAETLSRRIEDAAAKVRKLEDHLKDLTNDQNTLQQRSKGFRLLQHARTLDQQTQIKHQMQNIKVGLQSLHERLREASLSKKGPERAQLLKSLQSELQAQKEILRQLNDQNAQLVSRLQQLDSNIRGEVAAEESEINAERSQIQTELRLTRSELEKLQLEKRSIIQDAGVNQQRILQLQKTMNQQRARVQSLEKALLALRHER